MKPLFFFLTIIGVLTVMPCSAQTTAAPAEPPILEAYPHLEKFLYKERESGFYFGLGASPVGIMKDRVVFNVDFVQLNYRSTNWDWQILNASYGFTRAKSSKMQSASFTFRSALRYRISEVLSAGVLVGYEFISFPNLKAVLLKTPYVTKSEPFSSRGLIYGAMISQTWKLKDKYLIQVNELAYHQTYSHKKTVENWLYYFEDSELRANPELIAPSLVAMIQVSFLF